MIGRIGKIHIIPATRYITAWTATGREEILGAWLAMITAHKPIMVNINNVPNGMRHVGVGRCGLFMAKSILFQLVRGPTECPTDH
jgi:hypothetical protein